MKSLQRSTAHRGRQNGDVQSFSELLRLFQKQEMIRICICDHCIREEKKNIFKADNYIEGVGIMQMSALFLRSCFLY